MNEATPEDEDRKIPFDMAATTIEQLMSEVLPQKLDSLAQHNRNIQQVCLFLFLVKNLEWNISCYITLPKAIFIHNYIVSLD